MKEIILINGKKHNKVAVIPDNLNNESMLNIIKMYLFNNEFEWDVFHIERR